MKLIIYKAIARPQRLAAIRHGHQSARPRVTIQTRSLTRQGHACKLGCPTYQGHDQKQPLAYRTIVTGRSDSRENHAHGLRQKLRNRGVEERKRTAKLAPFATKTIELTVLVPLPQGSTHFPDAPASRQDEPGPRTGSYPAAEARDWKSVRE